MTPPVPDSAVEAAIGAFLAELFGFPPERARQVLGAFAEEGTDVQVDLTDAELTIEGACGFGLSGERFLERFRAALPILRADQQRVAALVEAARPLAALAESVDRRSHPDDSTCPHRIEAGKLRRLRDAVDAFPTQQEAPRG